MMRHHGGSQMYGYGEGEGEEVAGLGPGFEHSPSPALTDGLCHFSVPPRHPYVSQEM